LIYPTRAAVIATAAGSPVALAVAAIIPGQWFLTLAWPLSVMLLCLLDGARGRGAATAHVGFPAHAYVGETRDCAVTIAVAGNPRSVQVALPLSPLVAFQDDGRLRVPLANGRGGLLVPLKFMRRGLARFDRLWLRWTGPLGLTWRQEGIAVDAALPILPDVRAVHDRGAAIVQRHAFEGLIAQPTRGEGSDFDALLEFRPGMDRRSIDWKQSARHMKLLAKQYRTERNNQILFAIDTGRQMSEPVAGVPRVDRLVSAMLLTAWIALKLGDRVALHAFDSRPRVSSGFVSSGRAFPELQRLAAEIDYSGEETNYTFALSTFSGRLKRRSIIVLFTEFTDAVSADFLLRALRSLVQKHLVLIVVLTDEELVSFVARPPGNADDVTRAVTAAMLLKERRVVITRLQHLGVHIIESEHDRVNVRLVQGYLDLKRRNLL
jgi:uncharacterized protein (DUF58 family)